MKGDSGRSIRDDGVRQPLSSDHAVHVQILMATHNGAPYLPAMINSLAAQRHRKWSLLVRDDGSLDETADVVGHYATSLPIDLIREHSIGHPGCFFRLLDHIDESTDIVALADQDDIWCDYKVARLVEFLKNRLTSQTPTLYCSRAKITSGDLVPRGCTPRPQRPLSFENALVQNMALGCTIAMNRAGVDLARSIDWSAALRHDWWLYLAFTGLGDVRYDPVPTLLYRQHAQNVVGAGAGPVSRLGRRLVRYIDPEARTYRIAQVGAFRRAAGPRLSPSHRQLVDSYLDARHSLHRRVMFAARGGIRFQSRGDELAFRTAYALGLF